MRVTDRFGRGSVHYIGLTLDTALILQDSDHLGIAAIDCTDQRASACPEVCQVRRRVKGHRRVPKLRYLKV